MSTSRIKELRTEHERLSQQLADMEARRDRLLVDNEETGGQRDALQRMATELSEILAARSRELAELERRLAELQARANRAAAVILFETEETLKVHTDAAPMPPGSDASLLAPGEHQSDDLVLVLVEDGAFLLEEESAAGGVSPGQIRGRYGLDGEMLTLLGAEGSTEEMSFAMRCLLTPAAVNEGFVVMDADATCVPLAGKTLSRPEGGAE